jgi:hypothetical protein
MAYWPASVPPGEREPAAAVARGSLHRIAVGAVRLVWWWPGMVVVLLAYVAVAVGLAGHPYNNLWGGGGDRRRRRVVLLAAAAARGGAEGKPRSSPPPAASGPAQQPRTE